MSGRFDDLWLCERVLFPDSRFTADALLALYKDKTLVESPMPLETLYTIVPDTKAATSSDRSIEANLRDQFGLALSDVAAFRREERLGSVPTSWSFNHSWALEPWARHLLSRPAARPVVLHFDAHDDLAAPKIGVTSSKGVFDAPMGGATLDLSDASTIEAFILRGFFGIGSFITPLVHTVAALDIVHIARDLPDAPEDFDLQATAMREKTLTGRELERPAVRLAAPTPGSAFRYTRTSDVAIALDRAAGRDVVLDIDLDYFCNAFDDKPSSQRPAAAPSSPDEIALLIAELEGALEASAVAPSLVTVALSPGFFPSDHWRVAIPRLRKMLGRLRV